MLLKAAHSLMLRRVIIQRVFYILRSFFAPRAIYAERQAVQKVRQYNEQSQTVSHEPVVYFFGGSLVPFVSLSPVLLLDEPQFPLQTSATCSKMMSLIPFPSWKLF